MKWKQKQINGLGEDIAFNSHLLNVHRRSPRTVVAFKPSVRALEILSIPATISHKLHVFECDMQLADVPQIGAPLQYVT